MAVLAHEHRLATVGDRHHPHRLRCLQVAVVPIGLEPVDHQSPPRRLVGHPPVGHHRSRLGQERRQLGFGQQRRGGRSVAQVRGEQVVNGVDVRCRVEQLDRQAGRACRRHGLLQHGTGGPGDVSERGGVKAAHADQAVAAVKRWAEHHVGGRCESPPDQLGRVGRCVAGHDDRARGDRVLQCIGQATALLGDNLDARKQRGQLGHVPAGSEQSRVVVDPPGAVERVDEQGLAEAGGGMQAKRWAHARLDVARARRLGSDQQPRSGHREATRSMCQPALADARTLPDTFDRPSALRR